MPALQDTEGHWNEYQTVKTLFPSSDDVDIAVFETNELIQSPYLIGPARKGEGPTFGQEVWFLGYPFGIHTHTKNSEFPFIKRGTISAIDASNPDAAVLYIDGFNNPGFSGGPILYWDFKAQAYRLLGVVMGYKEDSAKIIVNGQHVNTQFLVNSGILVGYRIEHAIKAIEREAEKP